MVDIKEAINYLLENKDKISFGTYSIVVSYNPDKMHDAYIENYITRVYIKLMLREMVIH